MLLFMFFSFSSTGATCQCPNFWISNHYIHNCEYLISHSLSNTSIFSSKVTYFSEYVPLFLPTQLFACIFYWIYFFYSPVCVVESLISGLFLRFRSSTQIARTNCTSVDPKSHLRPMYPTRYIKIACRQVPL